MRTLVHLSDLHFGRIEPGVLEPLRRKIVALAPDLVVVSGDLTQRARAAQFREARAFLDSLPKPQIVVPGNHDVPLYNVVMRFAAPLHNFTRYVSADLQPSYVDDEIAVVGVNTARSTVFKGGRINEGQVERARAVLCDLPAHVTKILVTHHPFDVPKESDEQDQVVGRARMALEQLALCGADILLSGHLHEAYIGHAAERFDIEGLSALLIQAGTATSSRTRESENTFNILRLTPGRIEIERQAWRERDFRHDALDVFARVDGHWHPERGPA
jgi:3',5'-cyclic AMP phosphodiesterase CpdA